MLKLLWFLCYLSATGSKAKIKRTSKCFIFLSGCEDARRHAGQPLFLSDLPVNLSLCLLQIQKRHSSSSIDERPSPSSSAREYVESLHQNSRVTLLFGKNNVLVQPVTAQSSLALESRPCMRAAGENELCGCFRGTTWRLCRVTSPCTRTLT